MIKMVGTKKKVYECKPFDFGPSKRLSSYERHIKSKNILRIWD